MEGGRVGRAAPSPPGAGQNDQPAVLHQTISFASVAIGPPMALFCADRGGWGRGVAGAGGLRCGGRGGRVAPPTSPARGRPADGFKPGPSRLARDERDPAGLPGGLAIGISETAAPLAFLLVISTTSGRRRVRLSAQVFPDDRRASPPRPPPPPPPPIPPRP